MRRTIHHWLLWSALAGMGICLMPLAIAADGLASDSAFFEKEVRPVVERRCFECHSHAGGKAKGGLVLDSKGGWQTGGESGPALIPRNLEKSTLIRAVRHVDDTLKMPPREKLPAAEIAVLEKWVAMGAPDPRESGVSTTHAKKGIDVDAGRKHWAYQPVQKLAVPVVNSPALLSNDIDAFIQARLQREGLRASPRADARILIRRLYYDLLGLPHRRFRRSRTSRQIRIPRPTPAWWMSCWPARSMASAGDGTGSMWHAMRIPSSSRSMESAASLLRTPIVTMWWMRSMQTRHSTG